MDLTFPRTHDLLRKEATADPIFLFQCRRLHYVQGHMEYRWNHETGGLIDCNGADVTDEEAIKSGAVFEHWTTECVFLTRQDGEDYGEKRKYRWPNGWRVYCVPADGDLVHVLAAATEGGRYK